MMVGVFMVEGCVKGDILFQFGRCFQFGFVSCVGVIVNMVWVVK